MDKERAHLPLRGLQVRRLGERVLLEEWKYRGDSLPRGDLRTHINLWLLDGEPPTDGEEVEITIENFTFHPLGKEDPE